MAGSNDIIVTVPWDDGSGDSISVSYDPTVQTEEWTASLQVSSSAEYKGSTSRSRAVTLFLERDPAVMATVNVVQRKPNVDTVTMEFQNSEGSWVPSLNVNSDEGVVKRYIRATFTHIVYDVEGKGTSTEVLMSPESYDDEFVLSLRAGSPSFVTVGKDSGGVYVQFGENTAGWVGMVSVQCTYNGALGSATTVGIVDVTSDVFRVKSILLEGSADTVNYVSVLDLPAVGGVVSLRYSAVVQMGNGSVGVKVFELGSSQMGGTLSGALLGGTLSYTDYAKWGSVEVKENTTANVGAYSLTWSWEGKNSTVVINQAAANVVTEVSRYVVLTIDPVVYEVAGGTGSYSVEGVARMSDGTVVPLGTLTSEAIVSSSASWVSASGGVLTVAENGDGSEDRTAVLTVTVTGYESDTVELLQESTKELRRELELTLVPASFEAGGGSGTYTVRGVIYMKDGTTVDGGDLTSSALVSSPEEWLSFGKGTFTVGGNASTASGREALVAASLDGWLNGEGLVSQAVLTVIYGVPTGGLLTVEDIPASGGSVLNGTLSGVVTQTRTEGDITEELTFTWDEISRGTWSKAVSAGSLGTRVVSRSKAGELVYSYVLNDVAGSISADVYQEANERTQHVPVITTFYYDDIAARGGSVYPTVSMLSLTTYTSGSTIEDAVIDSVRFSGLGVSSSRGEVSSPSLDTAVRERQEVTMSTVRATNGNGQTARASVTVYQEANVIESYEDSIDTLVLDPNPVSGGGGDVMFSGRSTATAVYTSEARGEVSWPLTGVEVSESWATVDFAGGFISVERSTESEERTLTVTGTYENGHSRMETLTQAGGGATVQLRVQVGDTSFADFSDMDKFVWFTGKITWGRVEYDFNAGEGDPALVRIKDLVRGSEYSLGSITLPVGTVWDNISCELCVGVVGSDGRGDGAFYLMRVAPYGYNVETSTVDTYNPGSGQVSSVPFGYYPEGVGQPLPFIGGGTGVAVSTVGAVLVFDVSQLVVGVS